MRCVRAALLLDSIARKKAKRKTIKRQENDYQIKILLSRCTHAALSLELIEIKKMKRRKRENIETKSKKKDEKKTEYENQNMRKKTDTQPAPRILLYSQFNFTIESTQFYYIVNSILRYSQFYFTT